MEATIKKPDDKSSAPPLSKKEIKKIFNLKMYEIEESLKDEIGGIPFEACLESWIKLQDEFLSTYGIMLGDKNWKTALHYYRNPVKNIRFYL